MYLLIVQRFMTKINSFMRILMGTVYTDTHKSPPLTIVRQVRIYPHTTVTTGPLNHH